MDNSQQQYKDCENQKNKSVRRNILVAAAVGILSVGTTLTLNNATTYAASADKCTGPTYTVVVGDTLSDIASKHHRDWHGLAKKNQLADPNLIYPGQVICIDKQEASDTTTSAPGHTTPTSTVTPIPSTPVAQPPQVEQKRVAVATVQQQQPAPVQQQSTPVPVQQSTPAPAQQQPAPVVQTQSTDVGTMIDQIFGPNAGEAKSIAECESGMNPGAENAYAIGGSHAAGLFQILYPSTWYTTSQANASPYNARANIIAAHDIFVRDGYSWREWTCR